MKKETAFFIFISILAIAGCTLTSPVLDTGRENTPVPGSELLYTLSIPDPHTHYIHVSITLPPPLESTTDIAMPAWSPGRYIIYDFARLVHDVHAESSPRAVPRITRRDKQTWRISGYDKRAPLTLHYRVYSNYASGTFSQVTSDGGIINGASVFMYVKKKRNKPIRLTINLPDPAFLPGKREWDIYTSLHGGKDSPYDAGDYEELIDSPISMGELRSYQFQSHGTKISLVFQSPGFDIRAEKELAGRCRVVCDTAGDMFGGFPFHGYTFHFYTGYTPGIFDGMEHMVASCMTDPRAFTMERLQRMTTLAAHEFFHVWNVKSFRPAEFSPYDLSREIYTPSLWIVEGLTRYYQNILQLRAGLMSRHKFREICAHYISVYESNPGKDRMSLEEASLLTWFDRWGNEEGDRQNTRISYYNKGAIVGLLLDLNIRGATGGEKGLDDVMYGMYKRYGNKKGYIMEDFYAMCEKTAGISMDTFFQEAVSCPGSLPYNKFGQMCGFTIENSGETPVPYTGMTVADNKIKQIIPGSPAEIAGLQRYDTIVQVDGRPCLDPRSISEAYPGEKKVLAIQRYGKEKTLVLVIGIKSPVAYTIRETALVDKETEMTREEFYNGGKK